MELNKKSKIESVVAKKINDFSVAFQKRHIADLKSGCGPLIDKRHNDFIYSLGSEFAVGSAFYRSFDSALGKMFETLGQLLASMFYEGRKGINSFIFKDQLDLTGQLVFDYDVRKAFPKIEDYSKFSSDGQNAIPMKHATDNFFYDSKENVWHVIELKFGCDLDIKKAKAEKIELVKQYFLMKNLVENEGGDAEVQIHLAAAYNKYGEGNAWSHPRVKQYFADEELLIGSQYWNLVCNDEDGYEVVLDAYIKNSELILNARKMIMEAYDANVQAS